MSERETLEQTIRELIAREDIDSTTFSNRLYQPDTGLFTLLGRTREERAEIMQTELWKAARQRLAALEKHDFERYRRMASNVMSSNTNVPPALQTA